jgi:hypothetical protein
MRQADRLQRALKTRRFPDKPAREKTVGLEKCQTSKRTTATRRWINVGDLSLTISGRK